MNSSLLTRPEPQHYFYPNRMGRVILLAMEEILGQSGVNAILMLVDLPAYINNFPPHTRDLCFPFEHVGLLQAGLESQFGPRAGRGLALRIGKACLKYGLSEFGHELGLTGLAFRLLPLQTKIKTGSEIIAALFNKHTDQQVRVEIDEQSIYWHIERCPVCWERHTEGVCCHLAAGLLQEALFWVSGGKCFEVEEKTCIACGDEACTIVINRSPMG